MSLIDIIHAQQARDRGEHATELKFVGKILDDAFPAELAAVSKELAKKSGLLSKMGNIGKISRKGLVGLALSGSLMFGGIAEAANSVPVGNNVSIMTRTHRLKGLTKYISNMAEQDPAKRTNLANWLYETPIHESQMLQHRRQVVWKGKKGHRKPVEAGPARSIFGLEMPTSTELIAFSFKKKQTALKKLLTSTSGMTSKQLRGLTQDQLSNLLMSNDKFAASIAVAKSRWIERVFGDTIPGTTAERAVYTADHFYGGKNREAYRIKYLEDNAIVAEKIKAAQIAATMKKHSGPPPPKTNGLVNDVLHNNKIGHNVKSLTKRNTSFFRNIANVAAKAARR